MASEKAEKALSRREREIMDILHEKHPLSAKEVQSAMVKPPSYSAVRALIGRLVDKGVAKFEQDGARYMYMPAVKAEKVQASAISRLIKTFFQGSKMRAVTALLDASGDALDEQELAALERKIARLKQKKRSE